MSNFRAALIYAVVGTLLGIVIATLVSPSLLSAELCGFSSDVALNRPCIDTVQKATSGLIRYQLYGGLGGALLGAGLGGFLTVRKRRKAAAAASAGAPPTAAPKP